MISSIIHLIPVIGTTILIGVGAALPVRAVEHQLMRAGLERVEPGNWFRSDKLTLSLPYQANIVLVNERTGRVSSFVDQFFRVLKVWTGPTDGSVYCYHASNASYDN